MNSAYAAAGGVQPQHSSARARLRNQLLTDQIDVTTLGTSEMVQPPQGGYGQRSNSLATTPGGSGWGPQGARGYNNFQHAQNVPPGAPYGQPSRMYGQNRAAQPAQPAQPAQQQQQQQQPGQHYDDYGNAVSPRSQKKAYSLTQKSIAGFFKHKGGSRHFGRAHRTEAADKEGEFDEEVVVDEQGSQDFTFSDVAGFGHKQDKFGHSTDTTPFIPTLVTKEHANMNNVEYRKNAMMQRKMAMNALAQQGKAGEARAMSLQGYGGSPLQGQQQAQARLPLYGARGGERFGGPPPPQQRTYAAAEPRSMSLMGWQRPGPGQPRQQAQMLPPPEPHPASAGSGSRPSTFSSAGGVGSVGCGVGPAGGSAPSTVLSAGSQDALAHTGLGQADATDAKQGLHRQQQETSVRGKLNVLQLSAPQAAELQERQRALDQRERELAEQEARLQARLREPRLNDAREAPGGDVAVQSAHEQPGVASSRRGSRIVDPGLERRWRQEEQAQRAQQAANRASQATLGSTFSDSPDKRGGRARTEAAAAQLYKLANATDADAYVTAQEFAVPAGRSASPTGFAAESSRVHAAAADTEADSADVDTLPQSVLQQLSLHSASRASDGTLKKEPGPGQGPEPGPSEPSEPSVHSQKGQGEAGAEDADPDAFSFENTAGRAYQPVFAGSKDVLEEVNRFKTITVPAEQLHMLLENRRLVGELQLVSTELAESIGREVALEEQIRGLESRESRGRPSESAERDRRRRSASGEGRGRLSLLDLEVELRKKSAKIMELIQQLNEERLKRYVAEEHALLQEHGAAPDPLLLTRRIVQLERRLGERR